MNSWDTKSDVSRDELLQGNRSVQELWRTTDDELFAITDSSVHLPDPLGPVEKRKDVEFDQLDSYEIDVEYLNNTQKIFYPFVIGGVLLFTGFMFNNVVAIIGAAGGVLAFAAGTVMLVKERNKVTACTHVTFHKGRFSTTVSLEGDVEKQVNLLLDNISEAS